ncbi:hypothetical protein [Shewanella sp. SR43-8]|uniref:hypothetical protein n=1 Tax=Shewanella sp. SR43-8 TaxID=2760938 RepID=UPI001C717F8F|nr:hypothetical protein [Shewanella sp. SR43-8]
MRDGKNAIFHKTLLGATIGDVVTSVIATASEAGINVFDYFTTLQQESEQEKPTQKITYRGIISPKVKSFR